ncbi:unnamed protein product [Mytilus edulis]|uniref:Apple domain-containing protein n=1 Tax=Mytilus edulis TaxID=6550 RepID=A0A8S3TRT5_MYTED|nr:unnamed protein product [Mytilus edulis]
MNNEFFPTVDDGNCYDELSIESTDVPSEIGSSGALDVTYSLEECADLCYNDGMCAAFQQKWNAEKLQCYRHYYDITGGVSLTRTPEVVFIKYIFTLNDNTSSTTPLISNYYCPISSSSVSPTLSSSYSSDITTSTLSETTLIEVYTTTSSSGVMTTSNVVSGTSSSTCYCPCSASVASSSITTEELQAKIDKIQTELTVDKKETSSYKRRLTSAPDNRVSAQSIGYVGVVILTIVIGLLIVIDIPTLVKDTRNFLKGVVLCAKASCSVSLWLRQILYINFKDCTFVNIDNFAI